MADIEEKQPQADKPSWSWKKRLAWGSVGLAVFAAAIVGGSYWYVNTLSPEEALARVDGKPETVEAAEAGVDEPPLSEQTDAPVTEPPSEGDTEDAANPETTPTQEAAPDGTENTEQGQPTTPPAKSDDTPAKAEPTPAPEEGTAPAKPPVKPVKSDTAAAKARIDAKIDGQLSALQNSCTGKMQSLVGQIVGELKADSDLQQIQSGYMGKIASAESGCDGEFQSILSQAKSEYKEEGIATSEMPGWQSSYESAKAAARSSALQSILAAASAE
ncbi:hypothetical protein PA598K_05962 [Paenibacillus sp. 598K]|uniref:hypothetical protein n=1 Tax=Paenibacillus sp. 598K TaxID=1117987 RepID=UPI000FF932F7|nr:hypothetical protein [Paenibacillus sp. 598K]GBF77410.1 hypothetical protein PA598K_05962 [Paenibacillus sp. 598K]